MNVTKLFGNYLLTNLVCEFHERIWSIYSKMFFVILANVFLLLPNTFVELKKWVILTKRFVNFTTTIWSTNNKICFVTLTNSVLLALQNTFVVITKMFA